MKRVSYQALVIHTSDFLNRDALLKKKKKALNRKKLGMQAGV